MRIYNTAELYDIIKDERIKRIIESMIQVHGSIIDAYIRKIPDGLTYVIITFIENAQYRYTF